LEKEIIIKYVLTKEGQRRLISQGGDGKKIQYISVPYSEELMKLATIDDLGNLHIDMGKDVAIDYEIYHKYRVVPVLKGDFDEPQTVEQLLEIVSTHEEKLKRKISLDSLVGKRRKRVYITSTLALIIGYLITLVHYAYMLYLGLFIMLLAVVNLWLLAKSYDVYIGKDKLS
jgi:hypothetical protein